jgi:hypothetical protein
MDDNKVQDTAVVLKSMTDAELAMLVSLISGDYEQGKASTMGTMCYLFAEAPVVFKGRKAGYRQQAAGAK